ncbi:MAG: carbohydrate binding domain-containing protein [Planctomycetota bacterium]
MCRRTIWLAVALLIGFMALSPGHAQDEIENILVNGGFEDGVETPWGTYGGVITEVVTELTGAAVPEGPIEGNFCLHIVVGAAGANFWEIGLNQTGLVFEAGKTYTLSVFLKSKEGALDINFKPELAQDPWTAPVEQAFVMTEEWAEYSITTGVISEDISPAEIVLHIGYAPGDFWIDGIGWYEGDYVPPNLGDKSVASLPVPEDGAIHPETWANLSWKPGDFAVSHDVYFGESLDDVHDGTEGTFQGNQSSTNFLVGFPGFLYPDGLVPGTTYYWRIDEVNEADPNSPWKGDVWSFSIPPKTAYFPDPIDGAEFVDLNARLRWTPGFGAKLHTVYLGDSFEDVNNATGGSPQGIVTYTPPSPLESEKVYYWRVDEFDVAATHKGDIWSFTTPGAVGNPQPANGVVDAQIVTTLNWTPADTAASSDLYLGIDADAVKSATTASPEYAGNKALGSESYDPGKLALDANYYWRVDAVYTDKTVKGLLWSFATADFIGVDDFESYNDVDPPDPNSNRIFDKWIDGFGIATNGALVGNDFAPYTEQAIVHGGAQSMPYFYDNNNRTSEATLTLVHPRDWTEGESTKLSLWFRGGSANAAERMFVALNGGAPVYHDDPAVTQTGSWTEWVIDLAAFGADLTNVNTITIGFGTKGSPAADGGTGTMYFDDIRLVK